MADLKTNYVDDVLDTTKNQLRKYQQIQNDDGTVSFVDVTEYTQVGTSFGAKDINDTNAAINDVNGKLHVNFDNYLGAITNNGNVTVPYDCWLIGTITSPSSEASYIKYGGSDGVLLYSAITNGGVIDVLLPVKANTKLYIRGGATVALKMFS